MCGKSAHGYNKKVGYHEHGKSGKLQASQLERLPTHDPMRVPSDKLEPVVWREVKKFILSDAFAKDLLVRAKVMQEKMNQFDETKKLNDQSEKLKKQIEVLAERIGLLPKDMDVKPLFVQMTKLQQEQKALEEKINDSEKEKPLKDAAPAFLRLSLGNLIYQVRCGRSLVRLY